MVSTRIDILKSAERELAPSLELANPRLECASKAPTRAERAQYANHLASPMVVAMQYENHGDDDARLPFSARSSHFLPCQKPESDTDL